MPLCSITSNHSTDQQIQTFLAQILSVIEFNEWKTEVVSGSIISMLLTKNPTGILCTLCVYHMDEKANSVPLINISIVFGTLPIIYSNTLLVRPFEFSCLYTDKYKLRICIYVQNV